MRIGKSALCAIKLWVGTANNDWIETGLHMRRLQATYRLNRLERGSEEFHTFCQTLNGDKEG